MCGMPHTGDKFLQILILICLALFTFIVSMLFKPFLTLRLQDWEMICASPITSSQKSVYRCSQVLFFYNGMAVK